MIKLSNKFFLLILLTFLFSDSFQLQAQTSDGEELSVKVSAFLRFKRGEVLFRTSETKFETIEVGQDLFEKDILKTEANSVAIIELPDSSKVKVGPNTELKIGKLVERIEDESFGKSSLILKTGKILIDVINKSSEPVLDVKTKNVSIAVRGTRFFVAHDQSDQGNLWVSSDRGELEVTSLRVKGAVDAIDGGQGIVVDQLGNFTQPLAYDWVKSINYDIEHRTPQFGNYSTQSQKRNEEFKKKRRSWKRDSERFLKRNEKWKRNKKRYKAKAEKFKDIRKKFRKTKRDYKNKRFKYFKKRKKVFKKIQKLKLKLRETKRSDKEKRKELIAAGKKLKDEYQTLKQEKRDYLFKRKKNLSKFAPKVKDIKHNKRMRKRRLQRRKFRNRQDQLNNQDNGGNLPPPPPGSDYVPPAPPGGGSTGGGNGP